ncbi:ead/Ea22-like family protein [Klebsiella pneumoniae]|uniref:ead/Ea22-like family protein n=1 Tax=Klebsiella pneumoniae TaxID=573 RepID=UPI002AABB729|nr:ead/Ea22-like family protein [Klebsiella pneumoniae]WPU85706.1 ead/Ea22-like family protein [Klebsiella pneumoniae]
MTDITELAQSLKAAAENAIGAHERLAAYPYGEIIDISQHEGEQIDIDITDLNEFNKEANPVNILALVEALEKAQTENTAGAAGMAESYETAISMLRSHIAELESRAVTVGNLQESAYRAGLTAGWNLGLANNNDGFNKCLAAHAAGIKVEAE